MRKYYTDVEFEVISGPRRRGDPHPKRKRWYYVGVDANGRAMWYRPPRFSRLQLIGLLIAGTVLFYAAAFGMLLAYVS